jgi:putative transcriptional regulator
MLSAVTELAPGFLIAVPQLGDPNFHRALILMLEHTGEGALGIVVNRTASIHLDEVARLQKVDVRPEMKEAPVYVGGPVQPERGFVLHSQPGLDESVEVRNGLYISSSSDSLKELLLGPPDAFRLCLGYAGWGAGQLEKEMQEGAWIAAPLDVKHVLTTPSGQAWESVLRDMGIDPAMLQPAKGLH